MAKLLKQIELKDGTKVNAWLYSDNTVRINGQIEVNAGFNTNTFIVYNHNGSIAWDDYVSNSKLAKVQGTIRRMIKWCRKNGYEHVDLGGTK